MDQGNWQEIERLFQAAMDLPQADRKAFVERECVGRADLAAEVLELLDSASIHLIGSVVSEAAFDVVRPDEDQTFAKGQRVGQYLIMESLGKGGMGQVFRAVRDDGEFKQEVAIKVLRPEVAHGAEVIARFLAERRILASLEHPYIARLIDGGTHQGRPYLVMEYAREGLPLDQFIKDRKLTTNEKLQLFLKICEAVQHAHQRLVIHRDLKPSNILVLPDGSPKLLDFGIAKLLDMGDAPVTQVAPLTATGWMMLTPDYASPEQVAGEQITVASDVYSLGVVLFEALTGERPYRIKSYSPTEIHEAVRLATVPAPSSVVTRASGLYRQIAGDLDNVVLMALRKESARRYQSVEQLAADIKAHLEGRTVSARRDTFGYRASKFVRRNRAVVALAAMLAVAIITGTFLTIREGRRAQKRFNEVRALANSMMQEVDEEASQLPGSSTLRKLLAKNSMRYLDGLSSETGDDASLALELAAAYHRVGANLFTLESGSREMLLLAHSRGIAIQEYWWNKGVRNEEMRRSMVMGYAGLANLNPSQETSAASESYLQKALSLAKPEDGRAYFVAHSARLHIFADRGQLREALASGLEAHRVAVQTGQWSSSLRIATGTADAYRMLGATHKGVEFARAALAAANAHEKEWRTSAPQQRMISVLLGDLGQMLAHGINPSENKPCEAFEVAKQAVEIDERLAFDRDRAGQSRWTVALILDYTQLADAASLCGKTDPMPSIQRLVELAGPKMKLPGTDQSLALAHWSAGRKAQALKVIEESARGTGREDHEVYELLARFLLDTGNKQAAWRAEAKTRELAAQIPLADRKTRHHRDFLRARSLYRCIVSGDPTPGLRKQLRKLVATFPPEADSPELEPIRKFAASLSE